MDQSATDFAISVLNLLNALPDEDVIGESDDPAFVLADALIESAALELLGQNHELDTKLHHFDHSFQTRSS